jgi:hypothetical protein
VILSTLMMLIAIYYWGINEPWVLPLRVALSWQACVYWYR